MIAFIFKLGITFFILACLPILAIVVFENLIDDRGKDFFYKKYDVDKLESIFCNTSVILGGLSVLAGIIWVFGVIWLL